MIAMMTILRNSWRRAMVVAGLVLFGHGVVFADAANDVSIVGAGVIDGAGKMFRDQGQRPYGVANKTVALRNCRNVTVRDITITMGGHFALLASGVDNFTIDNVKVDTDRDGIDLDCCRNVRVSNCTVNSQNDDAICLKSTYTLGEVRPTENVTITNCQRSEERRVGKEGRCGT